MKLKFALAAAIGGILTFPAIAPAQVTVRSNGVVQGTIVLPNRNPNFNNRVTKVDTDAQGRYYRNGVLVYQAPDPRLVQVDAQGRPYVDFLGIPVVSTNGSLTSPVLSDGELQPINRFNHNTPVRFYGTVQDEFVVLGQYTGIVTNPATGDRYQGTFAIRGQGPRYSDRNGGLSPTVFDFQSARSSSVPATRTVFSYTFGNMPVNLQVTVPAGLTPLPGTPGTPTPPVTPGPVVPPVIPGPVVPPVTPGPSDPSQPSFSNTTGFFEVTRVVLEKERQQSASVGPRSRVLLQQ